MHKPVRLVSPHRFARLRAWARAMLAWAMLVLCVSTAVGGRRLRQRCWALSPHWAERAVRALAMVRAVELTQLRVSPPVVRRNAAPQGFRRRLARGALRRASVGSRFRKALRHRDLAQRLQRISAALADIDAFARRYLAPRVERGLTRLYPVLMRAPCAETLRSRAAPCAAAPTGAAFCDSS